MTKVLGYGCNIPAHFISYSLADEQLCEGTSDEKRFLCSLVHQFTLGFFAVPYCLDDVALSCTTYEKYRDTHHTTNAENWFVKDCFRGTELDMLSEGGVEWWLLFLLLYADLRLISTALLSSRGKSRAHTSSLRRHSSLRPEFSTIYKERKREIGKRRY